MRPLPTSLYIPTCILLVASPAFSQASPTWCTMVCPDGSMSERIHCSGGDVPMCWRHAGSNGNDAKPVPTKKELEAKDLKEAADDEDDKGVESSARRIGKTPLNTSKLPWNTTPTTMMQFRI
jgi:hypothetical protein